MGAAEQAGDADGGVPMNRESATASRLKRAKYSDQVVNEAMAEAKAVQAKGMSDAAKEAALQSGKVLIEDITEADEAAEDEAGAYTLRRGAGEQKNLRMERRLRAA